jgi:hypothetical protein
VELLYSDDRSVAGGGTIDPDTRRFTINFAPEGSFLLTVRGPHEGSPGTSEHDRNSPLASANAVVRAYDSAEVPLVVHGDVSGVTLPVKEQVKGTK